MILGVWRKTDNNPGLFFQLMVIGTIYSFFFYLCFFYVCVPHHRAGISVRDYGHDRDHDRGCDHDRDCVHDVQAIEGYTG